MSAIHSSPEDDVIVCDANLTESGNATDNQHQLAELRTLIPGTVVFFSVLPFVLFHFRFLPLGTTPAILLGALLMVATRVVSQSEAYDVMGHRDNLTAIFLLLGMMLLAQYIEREQVLVKILRRLLHPEQSFANYIWRICLLSFVLSALFTNDACCAIFTPLVLTFWKSQQRPKTELPTILLAIATSANIGSVATTFGNPQMALIAAKTSGPEFSDSRLDMIACTVYLLPPALIIGVLNTLLLILHQKILARHSQDNSHKSNAKVPGNGTVEVTIKPAEQRELVSYTNLDSIPEHATIEVTTPAEQRELVSDTTLDTIPENATVKPAYPSKPRTRSFHTSQDSVSMFGSGLQLSQKAGIYKSVSAVSASEFLPPETGLNQLEEYDEEGLEGVFSPGDSAVFPGVLLALLVAVVALFLASTEAVPFDLGLVPMGAATLALVADAALNRRSGLYVIKRVDWSILLMFLGLFVYIHGFNNTRLPHWLWARLGLHTATFESASEVAVLTCFVVLGSNLFSNVPLVLILLDQLQPCVEQKALVIYLAWVSTIAGNLTLFGSVANLIVQQKGLQTLEYRLTFGQYFAFGFPTTILNTILGILIISGFLLIPM